MHPIDLVISLFLGVGFLVFFLLAIKQVSAFITRCIWYTGYVALRMVIVLILYRIACRALSYYRITNVFGLIELSDIDGFLAQSIAWKYTMGLLGQLTGVLSSFIDLSQVGDAWFYVKELVT